ncbi:hypothetical protein GCM10023097_48350 [Streptomyces collinus]
MHGSGVASCQPLPGARAATAPATVLRRNHLLVSALMRRGADSAAGKPPDGPCVPSPYLITGETDGQRILVPSVDYSN